MATAQEPARQGGRPSLRTPEVEERVVEALALGLGVKYAADYAGIGERTLQDWLAAETGFSHRVKRARAEMLVQVASAYHEQGIAGRDNKPAYRILAARDQGFVEAKTLTINSGAEEARLLRQAAYAIDASIEGPPREAVQAMRESVPGPAGPSIPASAPAGAG